MRRSWHSGDAPSPRKVWRLGDLVEKALSSVGVTEERVESWIGAPCGCRERKKRLNALSLWAQRVIQGKTADEGKERLDAIIGDDLDSPPTE